MGQTHIRTPKNFVLEERLERYADAIEVAPETYRGSWAAACAPVRAASASTADDPAASPAPAAGTFDAVYLDLGCGKGAYLAACAARDPRSLYLGMDTEPICIAYAAQRIVENRLKNALVLPRSAESLARIFAPGELAGITLNFPTPFPKRKYAGKRLVNVDHLLAYRALLAPDARVTLRTDSQPLRDYALTQFEAAGYALHWVSDDVRAEHPGHPETEYEARLAAQGAAVYGICATPAAAPTPAQIQAGRDAEQSLAEYLPRDLNSLAYVPLGMEGYVVNARNRMVKGKAATPNSDARAR